jgi:hypothetical protein
LQLAGLSPTIRADEPTEDSMAALFSAIWKAIRGAALYALYAFDWLLMMPFRLFGPPAGRSAIEGPPEIGQGNQSRNVSHTISDADRSRTLRRKGAAVVWCEARLTHGSSVAKPGNAISPATAAWLVNLNRREAEAVIKAGYIRVSRHIAGEDFVDGVPSIDGTRWRKRQESLSDNSPIDDGLRLNLEPSL